MNLNNPILTEVTRGKIVESVHRGAVAVMVPDGQMLAKIGDTDFVTYLRSSAKPHQTLAVITSGAADHFHFTLPELALMAGSHSGEPYHVESAASILNKLSLSVDTLCCGIHPPFSRKAAQELSASKITQLHNNCSGKHAGMLAQALMGNHSLTDYYCIDHPVQQAIANIVAQFADLSRKDLIMGIDGCSAATFAMSIEKMALIYARLVNPLNLPPELKAAAEQVVIAMTSFPHMVAADTERIDTDLMRLRPGHLLAKAGAEGVYTMALRPCAQYPQGLGIAIKIEDGDINRARNATTVSTLLQLGIITQTEAADLAKQYFPPLKNLRGLHVGEVHPVFQLES